jgi:LPS-assembly protein
MCTPPPLPLPGRCLRGVPRRRLLGLCLVAAWGTVSAGVAAQAVPGGPAAAAAPATAAVAKALSPLLLPSTQLQPLPGGKAGETLPIILRARSLTARPDLDAVAEGDVEFRRGGIVIRAGRVTYDVAGDLATASGGVRVQRDGAVYVGRELQLRVQRFEGVFLDPRFDFPALGAGGQADRIEFLDSTRSRAVNAAYTSCPRPAVDAPAIDPGAASAPAPAWVLQARSVQLDLATGIGVAEGATLRFLDTPILGWPALSFPLGDQRKSGWLPPSINIDNRSGLELSVPYYWNIAPNRDATISPRIITRRGPALDAEFRWLQPRHRGEVSADWLPDDRVARRARHALRWHHEGALQQDWARGLRWQLDGVRVSDNDWWKDFPGAGRSLTTRLLPQRGSVEWPFAITLPGSPAQAAGAGALDGADTAVGGSFFSGLMGSLTGWTGSRAGGPDNGLEGQVYGRLAGWQVLQSDESRIASPYQRRPQLGAEVQGRWGGWQLAVQAEFNRFTLPQGEAASGQRPQGDRLHLLAGLAYPLRGQGWWLRPRLAMNAAAYDTDQPGASLPARARRAIPTFSLDGGMVFDRSTSFFGRALQQTLEPRVLYVNTPFRAQAQLPNYDAAAKDFNTISIYSDNSFSGVDRVADAHQVTAGFTTRLVDEASGAEALRLGLVQRYLLRAQRIAPQADGSPDGPALTQKFSDALLVGSTSVVPGWTLDAAVQYSPELARSVRSILAARYSPGAFRTVGATYRLARGLSEQLELGWQWPIGQGPAAWPGAAATAQALQAIGGRPPGPSAGSAGTCTGRWYSVGRVNYSLKDTRITDSLVGFEYDAGCWVGRVVAERLSTGRAEATTRLLLQLELVGLSRLGSNPLRVLKDNIPGYQLLREDRDSRSGEWQPAP